MSQGVSSRSGERSARLGSASAPSDSVVTVSSFTGENVSDSWAEIVDCGDAPLTPLAKRAALKKVGLDHQVSHSPYSKHAND